MRAATTKKTTIRTARASADVDAAVAAADASKAKSSLTNVKAHGRISDELVDDLVDAGSREHYADAALYDYEYRRRRADVTFYRELAKQRLSKSGLSKSGGGPILELGAGSGRVTVALARD